MITPNDVNDSCASALAYTAACNTHFAEATGAWHNFATLWVLGDHRDNAFTLGSAKNQLCCLEVGRRLNNGMH